MWIQQHQAWSQRNWNDNVNPDVAPSSSLSILLLYYPPGSYLCLLLPSLPFTFLCICILHIISMVTYTAHFVHCTAVLVLITEYLESLSHFVQILERNTLLYLCPMNELAPFWLGSIPNLLEMEMGHLISGAASSRSQGRGRLILLKELWIQAGKKTCLVQGRTRICTRF